VCPTEPQHQIIVIKTDLMKFGMKHSLLMRLSSAVDIWDTQKAGWVSPKPSESLPSLVIFENTGEKLKDASMRVKGTKESRLCRRVSLKDESSLGFIGY
jgi:hypothetical protein